MIGITKMEKLLGKKVMSELQDMDESHYYMITNLKTSEGD